MIDNYESSMLNLTITPPLLPNIPFIPVLIISVSILEILCLMSSLIYNYNCIPIKSTSANKIYLSIYYKLA